MEKSSITSKKIPIRELYAPPKLARRDGKEVQASPYRTPFMRDRDRVLYSSAFRMLAGKTQVYITGIDDNMRTRLTHTLEVSQIAKTIATNLVLDVDLVEAIALAHDIGHTPYGHAGERILHTIMNPQKNHPIKGCPFDIANDDEEKEILRDYCDYLGFKHNLHSVEVAIKEAQRTDHQSMSLTNFTLYGMKSHSSLAYKSDKEKGTEKVGYYRRYEDQCAINGHGAWSFEAFVVAEADEIAQAHHDLEDAIRGKLITPDQVYKQIEYNLSPFFSTNDQATFKHMEKAIKDNNIESFFAELSRLIVNLFVSRLIMCSIRNINGFIFENSMTRKSFITFVEMNNEDAVKELISYDYNDRTGSPSFKKALSQFRNTISKNVLDAYDIQKADAKGAYVIRKIVQALYTTPKQLTDDCMVEYVVAIGKYKYQDAKKKILLEGIGSIRKECIESIETAQDALSTDQKKVDGKYVKELMTLLRTICNYIAGMTDRELQMLYREFYG